jgi:hypothetical protein
MWPIVKQNMIQRMIIAKKLDISALSETNMKESVVSDGQHQRCDSRRWRDMPDKRGTVNHVM